MLQFFEIPTSAISQRISIPLGTRVWVLVFWWNAVSASWMIDFKDEDDQAILVGVPMVTGCDLVGQHRHLGFEGSIVAQSDDDPRRVAGFADLGDTGRLYFITGEV